MKKVALNIRDLVGLVGKQFRARTVWLLGPGAIARVPGLSLRIRRGKISRCDQGSRLFARPLLSATRAAIRIAAALGAQEAPAPHPH